MRTLIMTLMVSGFALGGFTAAHAADAVEQIPQPPVAQVEAPPAINNWSGFYIGGTGSYNMGHFNHNGNSYAWVARPSPATTGSRARSCTALKVTSAMPTRSDPQWPHRARTA